MTSRDTRLDNWHQVLSVFPAFVVLSDDKVDYRRLMDAFLILRPGSTEWEPCSKEVAS